MSSASVTAVLNLSQGLTADEFRLLLMIAEMSTEYDGWLLVNWAKVLDQCRLTERQGGRILRGLQADSLIAISTDNPALHLSVSDLRGPIPIDPGVLIWIDGMDRPGTQDPPRAAYRKHPIPRSIRDEVFARDNYTCQHCGGTEGLTVDHVYPESKGGPANLDNLQTLCRSCNSRKGARIEA